MAGLTPIKIRGKRNAPPEQKLRQGKRRKITDEAIEGSPTPSIKSSNSSASGARRKRKSQKSKLSRLEQLPTEILQLIFEFSCNVDLPLTSPTLSRRLSSNHLYNQVTTRTLRQILTFESREYDKRAPDADVSAANRLMNSKFFTWSFFKQWLVNECKQPDHYDRFSHRLAPGKRSGIDWRGTAPKLWAKLRPDPRLLPPKKLIAGPWDQDTADFFTAIMSNFKGPSDKIDPVYLETARGGLEQAVLDGVPCLLGNFWSMGIEPDAALLRDAVLVAKKFNKTIVSCLIARLLYNDPEQCRTAVLDPALWAWADRAKAVGDENGQWLMMELTTDRL